MKKVKVLLMFAWLAVAGSFGCESAPSKDFEATFFLTDEKSHCAISQVSCSENIVKASMLGSGRIYHSCLPNTGPDGAVNKVPIATKCHWNTYVRFTSDKYFDAGVVFGDGIFVVCTGSDSFSEELILRNNDEHVYTGLPIIVPMKRKTEASSSGKVLSPKFYLEQDFPINDVETKSP